MVLNATFNNISVTIIVTYMSI